MLLYAEAKLKSRWPKWQFLYLKLHTVLITSVVKTVYTLHRINKSSYEMITGKQFHILNASVKAGNKVFNKNGVTMNILSSLNYGIININFVVQLECLQNH